MRPAATNSKKCHASFISASKVARTCRHLLALRFCIGQLCPRVEIFLRLLHQLVELRRRIGIASRGSIGHFLEGAKRRGTHLLQEQTAQIMILEPFFRLLPLHGRPKRDRRQSKPRAGEADNQHLKLLAERHRDVPRERYEYLPSASQGCASAAAAAERTFRSTLSNRVRKSVARCSGAFRDRVHRRSRSRRETGPTLGRKRTWSTRMAQYCLE